MSEGVALAHVLIALAYMVIGAILGSRYIQPHRQTLARLGLFTFFWGCAGTHWGLMAHVLTGDPISYVAWHHVVPALMQVIGAPTFIWAMWPYIPTILAPARMDAAVDMPMVTSDMASRHGTIRGVNPALLKLLGYEHESELVGKPLDTLIPPRYRKGHHHFRAGYVASPRARPMGEGAELSILTKDGTERKVRIGLAPIGKDVVASAILHIEND